MRRQIELAIVAVVAAVVGALAYHIVAWWPHPVVYHSGGSTAPPTSFKINGQEVQIHVDNDPLPLTFEVTGSGEADVTYAPGPDGTEVHTRVTTPWKVTVMAPAHIPARDVKMSATTTSDRDDAEITCRIGIAEAEFTGVPMSEDVAYGPHAVADCL
jgi:hypothetical protein